MRPIFGKPSFDIIHSESGIQWRNSTNNNNLQKISKPEIIDYCKNLVNEVRQLTL